MQLGIALAQTGNTDEALPQFHQPLEFAPDDPDVRTNADARARRQAAGSDQQLHEALRLNPNSPEAQNNLGLVFLMQGEPEKSVLHFSNTLRLKPDYKVAQDNLNRAQAQIKARRE